MNDLRRLSAPAGMCIPLILALMMVTPAASAYEDEGFSEGELAQMLAPIALYPDALLSQILMASTYPLEVVEAARWSRRNPDLEGQAAVNAVEDRDWDPSVKALVAFPRILAQMSDDLAWTRNLGDAVLLQEEAVSDVIQELRHRAHEAGQLEQQEHIRVVRDREVIIIEQANPRVVYVPYYRPTVVYGGWWWPAYPPVYWYPPYGYSTGVSFTWISGVPVSHGFFFSSFNWTHRHVVVVHHYDRHRHLGTRSGLHRWRHDPWHRRGVAYRHPTLHERYVGRGPAEHRHRGAAAGGRSYSPPALTSGQPRGARSGSPERPRSHSERRGPDTWAGGRTQRPAPAPRAGQSESGPGVSTRRPATANPNHRDRSTYGQQTEILQRDLDRRRPHIGPQGGRDPSVRQQRIEPRGTPPERRGHHPGRQDRSTPGTPREMQRGSGARGDGSGGRAWSRDQTAPAPRGGAVIRGDERGGMPHGSQPRINPRERHGGQGR